MTLTTAQHDRACGVLLGTAAGDALGAAYELGTRRGPELEVAMVGGGAFGWEPGEWTDDTSMAIAIADVAATVADLREEEALDSLAQRWHDWCHDAKDVGAATTIELHLLCHRRDAEGVKTTVGERRRLVLYGCGRQVVRSTSGAVHGPAAAARPPAACS